jgi:hypothetical protein
MAYYIFFGSIHLGKGSIKTFWNKDWIVTEPLIARFFSSDIPSNNTFKKILFALKRKCNHRFELRCSIRFIQQ